MSTAVLFILGVVGVGDIESNLFAVCRHLKMNKTGQGRAYAMFEGILYKRDEEHRGDFLLRVLDGEVCTDVHRLWEPDAHQLDIVLHKLHFVSDGNGRLLVVIENVAQHL